jgi:EAL domain-containing protein (putative c-di-GMP-specific phosphodiesterase class I)
VSPLQVADPRFPGLVERILRSTGIEPGSVSLELTESLVMERTRESLVTLEALKELGVRLVLDDFGTGYSSLGYLKGLPFDSIKLDRTFVGHLGTDRADDAIVTALVALGQTLGLTIVAEGVETAEQVEIVRELGCQYAQGFYFSHPVAADVFEGLLGEPLELAARG